MRILCGYMRTLYGYMRVSETVVIVLVMKPNVSLTNELPLKT